VFDTARHPVTDGAGRALADTAATNVLTAATGTFGQSWAVTCIALDGAGTVDGFVLVAGAESGWRPWLAPAEQPVPATSRAPATATLAKLVAVLNRIAGKPSLIEPECAW